MKKIIIVTGSVIILAVIAVLFFKNTKKTGYINTYELYDQFKLKKELEDKLKKTQLSRQSLLDSIKAKLQFTIGNPALSDQERSEKASALKESYYMKEKQFDQENQAQVQQYDDQVWEQLNQYVKEYGKEKNYKYILGANGQGSLMYADEETEITKEVLEFVNNKYDGKSK